MNLSDLIRKIALGTVQLGLPYGINNRTGKPNREEAFEILNKAVEQHIYMLDSAEAYGDSIQIIGDFLKAYPTTKFNIISKFIIDGQFLPQKLLDCLTTLNTTSLYGYMYHRFNDYALHEGQSTLQQLKLDGKVKKIGVSVYSNEEFETAINDSAIDLIQLPFNLFDVNSYKYELLKKAKAFGKEIHVRSIFLQGLLFKKPHELTGNLRGLLKPLKQFHAILEAHNLSVAQACLNHALHNPFIDYVIVGVEKSSQLDQNIASLLPNFSAGIIEQLESIQLVDKTLLNPTNWEP